jgi:hypothetical protein
MVKIVMAAGLALLLAGCGAHAGSLCSVGAFRPDPGASERWTDGEKDQLIVLNESGERICGWKP